MAFSVILTIIAGGVLQLTKACALEYAKDHIHFNCITPGYVETPMIEQMKNLHGAEITTQMLNMLHPWGRLGLAHEIANMAVFLAGPGASFCTGAPFVVDGGYVAQ